MTPPAADFTPADAQRWRDKAERETGPLATHFAFCAGLAAWHVGKAREGCPLSDPAKADRWRDGWDTAARHATAARGGDVATYASKTHPQDEADDETIAEAARLIDKGEL